MKIVGMIPARAGSKRVPGKNMKLLCGKPLVAYTIDAALNSECIDEVYVNTENSDILKVAEEFGARTFRRSLRLATDEVSMKFVVQEFARWIKTWRKNFAIVVLYPTYPFRTSEDIDKIVREYLGNTENPLIGLKKPKTHPYMCYKRENNEIKQAIPFDINRFYRGQDYPEMFELTHFACVVPDYMHGKVNNQLMSNVNQRFIDVSAANTLDIDTMDDWNYAEYLLEMKHEGSNSVIRTV